jgi:hypothetical protein
MRTCVRMRYQPVDLKCMHMNFKMSENNQYSNMKKLRCVMLYIM